MDTSEEVSFMSTLLVFYGSIMLPGIYGPEKPVMVVAVSQRGVDFL
jgi:hypothetical protein